ncbi:hypothetical protein SAY86_001403 [Trapa natans]|uniref:Uncharacterized protein n=1 Tax=Trapa natans TaxID=22666 RepID=A0AAN7MVZ1_TRANT|nr:hypothetical protein SAY86_001403 [Trapa natans]
MQITRQSDGTKHWPTDHLDTISSNSHLPVESCTNGYMTSDVEEHTTEGLAHEAEALAPDTGSPFANDFGIDSSELPF